MTWEIRQGHVLALLRAMESDSVHCCITSPPYFGLRAYGTEPQVWGANPLDTHEHVWGREIPGDLKGGSGTPNGRNNNGEEYARGAPSGRFCEMRCGAWRGELGSEPDPMLFVAHLVDVFREVRRVLRTDGTLWLNIGASYAGSGKGPTGQNGIGDQESRQGFSTGARIGSQNGESGHTSGVTPPTGFKPKDLIMTPFFVAEALRQDGWWLRQVIIWDKPACMPESVTDRCTTSHEYVFLLSKSKTYYFDADAIREPSEATAESIKRAAYPRYRITNKRDEDDGKPDYLTDPSNGYWPTSRNKRTVWRVTSEPLSLDHYAAFPSQLVEPMILAGTSAHGVCSACGAPWRRVVATHGETRREKAYKSGFSPKSEGTGLAIQGLSHAGHHGPIERTHETTAWEPTCSCNADVVPALVLDPFAGSGTTLIEALRHGRRVIGLELSEKYVEMARRRIVADAPLFNGGAV